MSLNEDPKPDRNEEPDAPDTDASDDAEAEEESQESFPASDAPSW